VYLILMSTTGCSPRTSKEKKPKIKIIKTMKKKKKTITKKKNEEEEERTKNNDSLNLQSHILLK
jgi:hypothetical protein